MVLLGKKGLLKDLRYNLLLADWCGAIPFKWNNSNKRLETKTHDKLKIYGVRLCIAVLYLICATIQVIWVFKPAPLIVKTHSIMFLASGILSLCCHFVNFTKLPQVLQLSNSFFDFEQQLADFEQQSAIQPPIPDTKRFLIKFMTQLMTSTGVFMPMVYHLDILRNPCFPLYVGYWMSDQCNPNKLGTPLTATWTADEILTKIGIVLVSYFSWSILLVGMLFQVSWECILQGHCFRRYLAEFGRILSSETILKSTGLKLETTLLYRQLQVMAIQYRFIYSRLMIGSLVPCLMVIETVCIYSTITLVSGKVANDSLGYSLLYAWCMIVCICNVIFMFGILADVFNVSTVVLGELNSNQNIRKNPWLKRWLRSCPVLKIYFGGTNYLDRLTPLAIEGFVIDQTVSLLLLNN